MEAVSHSERAAGRTRRHVFGVGAAGAAAVAGMATVAAPGRLGLLPQLPQFEGLEGLEEWLGRRVIGQERVLAGVAGALRHWTAQAAGEAPPMASFLFLGPPHVGKTLLAKQLARRLFGSDGALTRVDLREALGDGAWLADLAGVVHARPQQVVLLDEIHHARQAVLAQVRRLLETGTVPVGAGSAVDARGTVLIITTSVEPAAWPALEGLRRLAGETVTFRHLTAGERQRVAAMQRRE